MVVSAKNGSMVAVTGSGIRFMSDSLIAFQPAIEEPSNISPSENTSSSIRPVSNVTCCHLPRGSVKRRSTYLTSLSLIAFRTSLPVFMSTPYVLVVSVSGPRAAAVGYGPYNRVMPNTISEWRQARFTKLGSDGVQAGFPSPDADGFLDVGNKNLAVADAAGLRGAPDRVDGLLDQIVGDHDLDFHLGQKVDDIFRAPVKFGVSLLPAKSLSLGDGDALESHFLKRFFHLVELERLDDGFDFFH